MSFSGEQAQRYSRQFILKEVGFEGQKKLLNAKVLVIGAGALGSAALMYLAAAGTGTVGIADYDTVELSNLHRQIMHGTADIGKHKTESAEKTIKNLNPDINIILHKTRVTADNIQDILSLYDIVIDATDRFETKFLINDACVLCKKPYIHAGVVRFGGQVMTYLPNKGPCLRCMLENIPPNITCAQAGVIGAVAGVLGSIEALEAIKYITGAGRLLTGRILSFDGLEMRFRTVPFPKHSKTCRVCGDNPEIFSLSANRREYGEKGVCTLCTGETYE